MIVIKTDNRFLTLFNRVINMFTDNTAERYIKELVTRYPALESAAESLDRVYFTIKNSFFNDKILFCAGNGGSAADCEHIAGELMKGFLLRRPLSAELAKEMTDKTGDSQLAGKLQMGLRCISLISHPALNTAYMNDVDPDMIYAQQLFALGRSGDVMIGISTSGGAANICNAFKVARAKGIVTVLFTGLKHGICEEFADLILRAPESETFKVQEYHLPLYHCLCMMLEDAFYGKR